jgi:uroporphyrin-3 C-methyltransferase
MEPATPNALTNDPEAPKPAGQAGDAAAGAAPAPVGKASGTRVTVLALLAVVLAAGFAGLSWYETRTRIGATQEELARRLRDIEADSREARAYARQAQDAQRELQAKVAQLEGRLAESQSQQVALEALYQDLSRGRDEWQLAEIEQVLAIASQQLQLSGNVRAALLALELAESRLARSDRPQFLPIRRALARDIERLKAMPLLDVAGISLKIDRLAIAVDRLALGFEERGAQAGQATAAQAAPEGFWARLGREIWRELRQLIVVRRIDGAEPVLLAPSQEYFLRENLRLRLLNARLSLLMRDEAGYRGHLRASEAWLRRHFDPRSKQTGEALAQLKELAAAPLGMEMPTISESLEAVRGYKSRRERGS